MERLDAMREELARELEKEREDEETAKSWQDQLGDAVKSPRRDDERLGLDESVIYQVFGLVQEAALLKERLWQTVEAVAIVVGQIERIDRRFLLHLLM